MHNEFPSIYVLAPFLGWLLAHLVKFMLVLIASGGREKSLKIFFRAGGMPSSHTSVVVAVLVAIAGTEGIGSPVFGLGAAFATIVIYDALNVRRAVGEQGDLLRKIAAHSKLEDRFTSSYGHTFPEVIGGAVVGLLVGGLLLQIL